MSIYSMDTTARLTEKLTDVRNLIQLVKNMKKPDNFTYVDVAKLHTSLDELKTYLELELANKQ